MTLPATTSQTGRPQILGPDGVPVSVTPRNRARAALSGTAPAAFPYDAANWSSEELGSAWLPGVRSPDYEINIHRDRMVARGRDLERNDGWARGAVMRILDNAIGLTWRLSARPDYRALARFDKGFDAVWAAEFRREVEALWRSYAEDPARCNDVERQLTTVQQFRLALRHKLIDGEALAAVYWLPERMDLGATAATSLLVLDPDRLSNPYEQLDTKYLRGGVEIDDLGVPRAYHIRKAHQYDWYNATESMVWERVPRETPDGRAVVIHDYERDRAGQHRGVGAFMPVLSRMKLLARYDSVELQAAAINAIFAAFLESPYDREMVEEALATEGQQLGHYQKLRGEFHSDRALQLNGARIATLFPGEKFVSTDARRPSNTFEAFEHAMLRHFSAAVGLAAEQVTQDWSRTNYSSARAALLEAWKTLIRRRGEFAAGFSTPFYAVWLQEMMETGALPLPARAPDFREARAAYARCLWIGPGRGWVDPVKEKQGAVLGLDAGLSTLEHEAAENSGQDWEEVLDQRAHEVKAFKDRGLALPVWNGKEAATETDVKPQPQ